DRCHIAREPDGRPLPARRGYAIRPVLRWPAGVVVLLCASGQPRAASVFSRGRAPYRGERLAAPIHGDPSLVVDLELRGFSDVGRRRRSSLGDPDVAPRTDRVDRPPPLALVARCSEAL